MDDDALPAEQLAYYRAGAGEYDRPCAELAALQELLACVDGLPIAGDVLELACGTGQWTRLLADRAHSVTAVDAAAEVLALARARIAAATVEFVEADLFAWQPPRRYDTVFFAFWLSHVPPARSPRFWSTVAEALALHSQGLPRCPDARQGPHRAGVVGPHPDGGRAVHRHR